MGEKLVIGPIDKGLRTNREAFNIDNDNFPTLINAYQWRGRVKRKRGTAFLGRLTRFFNSTLAVYNTGSTTITLGVGGTGNLLNGFSLQANGNIIPGSVTLTGPGGPFTDPTEDGFLTPTGTGGVNTINYGTGAIVIPAQAGNSYSATFLYYPDLPVMGLEDFVISNDAFPETIAFDTVYSYAISNAIPFPIHDVSFYKNPAVNATTLPGYIPKTAWTQTTWNGQDYQQFWTVNYQGALWTTNGINIPFSTNNIGMQFKLITNIVTILAGPPATATITIVGHGLVVGDFVFINEVIGFNSATTPVFSTINFQTGYVISVTDTNNVVVEFPNATLNGTYSTGGIAQYLTNRSSTTIDSLRWYDGDPTNGNVTTPGFTQGLGWVNFAPPLSKSFYSISDLPPLQYYLVGARMIVPFKDRLVFLGPVVQSSGGAPIYLQDTVIFSQNGTPYYTSSFTGDPSLNTTVFFPVLVPINQTATAPAYWEDQTGFGGFQSAGIDQAITTAAFIGDDLIIGFNTNYQTKLIYSANDIRPFDFFLINSELGSTSTFSAIVLDKFVLTRGARGFIATSQVEAQRFDLEIPDQVFEISLLNNGTERICSQRDFINEWIYFTYPVNSESDTFKFPNQTLQYNYRDETWAIFNEAYTTYGTFRKKTGLTWGTVGATYPTWREWNVPWNNSSSSAEEPVVIAGNQQGFIAFRDEGTGEEQSLYIQGISGNTVTSPNHSLNEGDYITISGVLGTSGILVNNKIFSVSSPVTANTFNLNPGIVAGTYFGGGVILRMYVPFIQTKQFPLAWTIGRKVRIGVQQYLFSTTANAQITLLMFLSENFNQDPGQAYNIGNIVPGINVVNGSLIYSTVLFTCPESINLGLTPFNTNLQMVTGINQQQIWHRMNTSLLGDTVQIGFTLNDTQMRTVDVNGAAISQFAEIEFHGATLDLTPSSMLC